MVIREVWIVVVVEGIAGPNLPSGEVTKLRTEEVITCVLVEAEAGVLTAEELKTMARGLSSLSSSPALIPFKTLNLLQIHISSVETTGEVVIMTNEINISILRQEGVEVVREEAIRGKISTLPMNTNLSKPSLLETLKPRILRLKTITPLRWLWPSNRVKRLEKLPIRIHM
jgi:hypothetical protein